MKKIVLTILAVTMGGFVAAAPLLAPAPVYAEGESCTCEGTTDTGKYVDAAILKDICDCGHGEAIKEILSLVVRIMTVGVGIFGAIGITISGIQYLTAGGNEEQTRKSKRRIFEIVIGFAAFFFIIALLNFLIPGFDPIF